MHTSVVRIGLALSLVAVSLLVLSCGHERPRELSIPAGLATQTLKELSRQAQIQIVFDPRSVAGVMTNAVEGRVSPDEALERMVLGTPLFVQHDDETGAFAVVRREAVQSSRRQTTRGNLIVMVLPDGPLENAGTCNLFL